MKKYMKQAVAAAKKTWKGSKAPTKQQAAKVRSLQAKRASINAQIRKVKGK